MALFTGDGELATCVTGGITLSPTSRRVTPDDRFLGGSGTKMYTAAAVLQLAGERRVFSVRACVRDSRVAEDTKQRGARARARRDEREILVCFFLCPR